MRKKIYLFVLLFTFINCFAIPYNWANDNSVDESSRAESAKENIDRKGSLNWLCKVVRVFNALHLGLSEKSALSADETNQFIKVLQLTLTQLGKYISQLNTRSYDSDSQLIQAREGGEGDKNKVKGKRGEKRKKEKEE